MKNFCCITPDRGDRPDLLEHCRLQMKKQTVWPFDHFVISYPPAHNKPDILPRIKEGINIAKSVGYEYVFIIENDDYYPDTYIEDMLPYFHVAPFVGIENTIFYRIQDNTYKIMTNWGRSSLFCTAFKISEFEKLRIPDVLYIDWNIWKQLRDDQKVFHCPEYIKDGKTKDMPIGIKHNIGFCPGDGHNNKFDDFACDNNGELLQSLMRHCSYNFYMNLKKHNYVVDTGIIQ